MSSWLSSLDLKSALETAASTLETAKDTAREQALKLRKAIEDDLSTEYERTAQQSGEIENKNPPPPPEQKTALERVADVGAQLFSPLDDGGGVASGPEGPDRVVMLPWEKPGLTEATRQRMRSLSQERAIFLAPPAGGNSSFRFDLTSSLPLIMEALSIDKRLEEQRHLLVPRQVTRLSHTTRLLPR